MEQVERYAELSVARGCAFAALAIVTMMVGFMATPVSALKFGGIAGLLVSAVLLLKASRAHVKPYHSTELWLMLNPGERPVRETAQQVIGAALKAAYLQFAWRFAVGASALLGLALLLALIAAGTWHPAEAGGG